MIKPNARIAAVDKAMMNLVARLRIRTPVNFVKTIIRDEGNTHIRCSLPRVAGISDYETKECKKVVKSPLIRWCIPPANLSITAPHRSNEVLLVTLVD